MLTIIIALVFAHCTADNLHIGTYWDISSCCSAHINAPGSITSLGLRVDDVYKPYYTPIRHQHMQGIVYIYLYYVLLKDSFKNCNANFRLI